MKTQPARTSWSEVWSMSVLLCQHWQKANLEVPTFTQHSATCLLPPTGCGIFFRALIRDFSSLFLKFGAASMIESLQILDAVPVAPIKNRLRTILHWAGPSAASGVRGKQAMVDLMALRALSDPTGTSRALRGHAPGVTLVEGCPSEASCFADSPGNVAWSRNVGLQIKVQ